ncbi:MAG: DUF2510 domain-containing protein [Actinomycetota bacterium]|jgi:hypothetical protein|nr:DUF2510 domain-containing protein [Actinomycetota bacterium]
MFFIIFGYRRRRTGEGVVLSQCAKCQQVGPHTLMATSTWLTLFFIPIIPLPRRHRLVCRQCAHKTTVRGLELASVRAAIAGASSPALSYGGGGGTAVNTENLSGVATALGVDPTVSPTPYGTAGIGAPLPPFVPGASAPAVIPTAVSTAAPTTVPATMPFGATRGQVAPMTASQPLTGATPVAAGGNLEANGLPGGAGEGGMQRWYPDPGGDPHVRCYWDGSQWSARARWDGQHWVPF